MRDGRSWWRSSRVLGAGRTGLRVPRAVEVATGYGTSFALLDDGRVFAWGKNDRGELGVGDRLTRARPEAWVAVPDAVEVALGWYWGCARTRNGAVWCWGDRFAGFVAPMPLDVPALGNRCVSRRTSAGDGGDAASGA